MKALDLFSGAGGLSLGAKLAGIDVVCSVEKDSHAAKTYKHNFPSVSLFEGDIADFDINSIGEDIDIIFGGPPCQGYSISNRRTRNIKNNRNWLFEIFIDIADEIGPKWIVFENVKGILETENGFFFELIIKKLKKIGYNVSHHVLNSVNHGVPQRRERVFIVGCKNQKSLQTDITKSPHITVHEAIGDLPKLKNGSQKDYMKYNDKHISEYAHELRCDSGGCHNNLVTRNSSLIIRRYRHIPQGGNWENIPASLMSNYKDHSRCHTGIYHRLNPHRPSVVIGNFRKNMLVHPTQHRGLSVREAARIQSFPDWFVFKGSIGFQQQQVGNAVPPRLANYLFQQIVAS